MTSQTDDNRAIRYRAIIQGDNTGRSDTERQYRAIRYRATIQGDNIVDQTDDNRATIGAREGSDMHAELQCACMMDVYDGRV